VKIIETIPFQLPIQEILQLLTSAKGREEQKEPPKSLLTEVEKLLEFAKPFIKPKALYDFFPSQQLSPRFLFTKAEGTILCVCTIGKALEEESNKLINKGELSQAVILDAIASCAAEAVAEESYQIICKEIGAKFPGRKFTHRFSPGYCRWPLEEGQRTIFNLLPAEKIDVRLTSSFLMIPQKSISFAVNVGLEIDPLLGLRECHTCDLLNCSFRRE